MAFQCIIQRSQGHYRRLRNEAEKTTSSRRRWLRKVKGKAISFRISRWKRLRWMRFIVVPRRVAELYAEVVKAMRTDAVHPTIVFSFQWGLPVLSHPSIGYRKRAVSLHGNLSFS